MSYSSPSIPSLHPHPSPLLLLFLFVLFRNVLTSLSIYTLKKKKKTFHPFHYFPTPPLHLHYFPYSLLLLPLHLLSSLTHIHTHKPTEEDISASEDVSLRISAAAFLCVAEKRGWEMREDEERREGLERGREGRRRWQGA